MVENKSNQFSIYARGVAASGSGNDMHITVDQFDMGDLIANFNAEDVLDEIDFSVIVDYVTQRQAEDAE